jgi:ABC-type glycerol-3-phosphate transport system substrate-binding protein
MKKINLSKKEKTFAIIKKTTIVCFMIVLFFMLANTIFSDASLSVDADETDATLVNTTNNGVQKYSSFLEENKKLIVSSYQKAYPLSSLITKEEYSFLSDSEKKGYPQDAVSLTNGSEISFELSVPKQGLYTLLFDYYLSSDTIVDTEASLQINDVNQYYESKQLVFEGEWITDSTEFAKDRYGNEIVPTSSRKKTWYYSQGLKDGSSLNQGNLYVKLEEGLNKITLQIKSGSLLLGSLQVGSKEVISTYQEYLQKHANASYYSGSLVDMGAENITSKSSLDIRIYALQSKQTSRYETLHKLLNAVYEASWDNGNQKITWNLEAPVAGMYALSFKYLQDAYLDMPVQRTIEINGEIPYEDLEAYPFYYTKKWKNETLHNENGTLYVYLEQGQNTLSMTVNMSIYQKAIEKIDQVMDEMSEMALQIKYFTNGQSDTYRNWNITKYIPTLKDDLLGWADDLDDIRDYLKEYSQKDTYSNSFNSLKIGAKKLRKLAKDPDQLPNQMTSFTDGSASVSQVLGNQILTLNSNPLGLERIYLSKENQKLPKTQENIFSRFWEGLKRFVASFFSKEYSVHSAADDEIEVWVNRSRQYVEIMQEMADEAGLKVKFSIMPDQNKLILANSSNDLPDVAMGISNWIPYDLALRGVTVDLRQFEGYSELVQNFAEGAMIPYAYEDGMYGIPETQDFYVTYYRTDIFASLGLECPSTWQELLQQLPILQRLGYNFYSPLSSYRGLKPYVATLPFFYQFGASGDYQNAFTGSLYSSDGMTTTLSDESFVEALKFMTNLFTIYDVPEETLSFYNSFRYGTLPLGIANSSTYTQLLIAAPEISGNWSISLHLGYENSSGDISRYATAQSQGITMFESSDKKQQGFDFIQWWMSTETQTNYIQRLYSMYGLEYLWYSANLDAFSTLPIDAKDKKVILEQLSSWAMEASRVPAAYMLERSISDAYSKVVYNGENVRIALDDAVIESNREIERKMTEFNYVKNGQKVKDYVVPNVYNIKNWLTRKER